MPQFCSACGAQMQDGSAACPACSKSTQPQSVGGGAAAAPAAAPLGMDENLAGALAYVTILPAIFFLVSAPYNQNRFVRFHAFQCLFTAAVMIALSIALSVFTAIPLLGLIGLVLWPLFALVSLGLFVLLVFKAYNKEKFKLPVIGNLAEQQADKM